MKIAWRWKMAAACAALMLQLAAAPVSVVAQDNRARQTGPRADSAVDGLYLAARQAEKNNDYAAAADLIDRAFSLQRTDPVLLVAAFRMRLAAGRVPQATELAPKVAAVSTSDALANLVIAIDAVRKKDFKAAEQSIARMPADKQLSFFRPYLLAWIKAGQRDFAAAQAGFESGTAKTDNGKPNAIFLFHSALVDELAGNKAEAERKLKEAYESGDAGNYRLATALAGFYRRNGKAKDADDLLRKFHNDHADIAPLDALLADKYGARAPQVTDGMAEVMFDLFSVFAAGAGQRDGSDDLAVILAHLTLDLRPDFGATRLLLAEIFERLENRQATLDTYRAIDKSSALYWRARLRAAAALDRLDREAEAVAQLKAMIGERAERYDAALGLADVLRQHEKFAEAVGAYDTAIERLGKAERKHWPMFYARGIALERSKQWQRAEADFKKALELQPDQPYVLNYLAYTWVDQGVNVGEAKVMLEKAVSLRPNDGAIIDSLAWALYRQGEFPKSVELLERAVALQSTDPTINEHLGDALWRVGRKVEARFQWQRALGLKPEKERVPLIEEKLKNGMGEDKPAGKGG